MAVAAATLMMPEEPPGTFERMVEPRTFFVDRIPLTIIAVLVAVQCVYFSWQHFTHWCAPRLQGWDLRTLGCLAWLAGTAAGRAYELPLLPLRAAVEGYMVLVACSAVPLLLLGGVARLESRPQSGVNRRSSHTVLGGLLVARVLAGAALLAFELTHVFALKLNWTVLAIYTDNALGLVTLLIAAALRNPGSDREAAAVSARRGSRWIVLLACATSIADSVWVFMLGKEAIPVAAMSQVYAYFALVIFGAADLDPRVDYTLQALPTAEGSTVYSKARSMFAWYDAFLPVPFDKPLFFSLRSALVEEPRLVPPVPQDQPSPEKADLDDFLQEHEHDSEGESIYAPLVGGAGQV
jgi:hypothetical protein